MLLPRVVALQAEVCVAGESVAQAGVVLGGVVDHLLARGQDVMFVFTMGAAPAHAFSRSLSRSPQQARVRIIT